MEVLGRQYIRLEVKATDFSLQKRKFLSFRFDGGYNIGFFHFLWVGCADVGVGAFSSFKIFLS